MLNTGFAHGFTFDAVQMPLNVMDAHYHSFAKKVVPVLVQHGIGVLGMKPLASGMILRSQTVNAIDCLHYVMNLPTSVVINGCDSLDRLNQGLLRCQLGAVRQPDRDQSIDRLPGRDQRDPQVRRLQRSHDGGRVEAQDARQLGAAGPPVLAEGGGLLLRLAPWQPRHGQHRFQHLYVWLLYGVFPLKWWFVDDFRELVTGRIGGHQFAPAATIFSKVSSVTDSGACTVMVAVRASRLHCTSTYL